MYILSNFVSLLLCRKDWEEFEKFANSVQEEEEKREQEEDESYEERAERAQVETEVYKLRVKELKERRNQGGRQEQEQDDPLEAVKDPPNTSEDDYAWSLLTTASWHAPALSASDVQKTMQQQQRSKFAAVPSRSAAVSNTNDEDDSDSDDFEISWRAKGV